MREVGINSGVELVERACAAGEECAAPERGEVSAWVCGLCVAACALPVVTIFNVNLGFLFAISMCDLFFFAFCFSISRTRQPEPAVSQQLFPQDPL